MPQQLDRIESPALVGTELHEQICTHAREIAQAAPPLSAHQQDVIRRSLGQSAQARTDLSESP